MNNIKCGLYTRVSTQQQAENDYGSLESQREKLESYCHAHGHVVHRMYEDGGYSGSTLERPALQTMMRDIVSHEINCVVVYKIDRLTRNMRDFYKLSEMFEEYDIAFVSVSQNFDTSNSLGRLSLNMAMSFAQFEREMIADRIRDKMRQRSRKGLWNGRRTPYGYCNVDTQLVPDPETAGVVRFMFEQYAEKPSLSSLREQLGLRGWLKDGKPWNKATLHNMLSNKIYIGMIKCNDTYYEGIHEPIIDKDVFDYVQSRKPVWTHTKTRNKRHYLLKGLLVCSSCGSHMTPHYTKKRKADGTTSRYPYYRCTRKNHHSYSACPKKSLNASKIETQITEKIMSLASNSGMIDRAVRHLNSNMRDTRAPLQKQIKDIDKRIKDIESEITRFINALGSGTLPVKRIEDAITEREGQITELQIQRKDISSRLDSAASREYNADALKASLRDFRDVFSFMTEKEKSEALQCFIKNIEVHPDKYVLNLYELQNVPASSQKRLFWWS